jgi:acetyl-CoA carboxylase beta subunit
MSERIALRCPSCQKVSYRPVGFVRAKLHFVCNYCHEMAKINHHQALHALAQHRREVGSDVLERVGDTADDSGRHS